MNNNSKSCRGNDEEEEDQEDDGVLGAHAVGRRLAIVAHESDRKAQHQAGIIVAYYPKTNKHRVRFDLDEEENDDSAGGRSGSKKQPRFRNVQLDNDQVHFYWLPTTSAASSSYPSSSKTTTTTTRRVLTALELAINRDAVGRRLQWLHPVRNIWYQATIFKYIEHCHQHSIVLGNKTANGSSGDGKVLLVDLETSQWHYTDLIRPTNIDKDERNPRLLETSKYMGVVRNSATSWKVYYNQKQQSHDNTAATKRHYIGCFSSEKDAALAYDLYARKDDAPVNFSDRLICRAVMEHLKIPEPTSDKQVALQEEVNNNDDDHREEADATPSLLEAEEASAPSLCSSPAMMIMADGSGSGNGNGDSQKGRIDEVSMGEEGGQNNEDRRTKNLEFIRSISPPTLTGEQQDSNSAMIRHVSDASQGDEDEDAENDVEVHENCNASSSTIVTFEQDDDGHDGDGDNSDEFKKVKGKIGLTTTASEAAPIEAPLEARNDVEKKNAESETSSLSNKDQKQYVEMQGTAVASDQTKSQTKKRGRSKMASKKGPKTKTKEELHSVVEEDAEFEFKAEDAGRRGKEIGKTAADLDDTDSEFEFDDDSDSDHTTSDEESDDDDNDFVIAVRKPRSQSRRKYTRLSLTTPVDGDSDDDLESSSDESEGPLAPVPRRRKKTKGKTVSSKKRKQKLLQSAEPKPKQKKASKKIKKTERPKENPKGKTKKAREPLYPVGTRFVKEFPDYGSYEGEVVDFDGKHYHVYYAADSDEEELSEFEFEDFEILAPTRNRNARQRPSETKVGASSDAKRGKKRARTSRDRSSNKVRRRS